MSARILWLVAARCGSKGLPGKNIRPLGGMPLLAWPILAARAAGGDVWLSTDDPDYAEAGRTYGAYIPFLRPANVSNDTASSVDVCLHAMRHAMDRGLHYDLLGLLQPTSPFVGAQSLRQGLEALASAPDAHSAVAMCTAQHSSLLMQPLAPRLEILAQKLVALPDSRRQALPQEIYPCGGFYIARWNSFLLRPTFYAESSVPVVLTGAPTLDIDTSFDFAFAEFLLATGQVDSGLPQCACR